MLITEPHLLTSREERSHLEPAGLTAWGALAKQSEDSTMNLGRSQEPTPRKFKGKLEKTVSEVKQNATSHSLHGMNDDSFTSACKNSPKKRKAGCDGKTLTSKAAAECVAQACNPTTERRLRQEELQGFKGNLGSNERPPLTLGGGKKKQKERKEKNKARNRMWLSSCTHIGRVSCCTSKAALWVGVVNTESSGLSSENSVGNGQGPAAHVEDVCPSTPANRPEVIGCLTR